MWIVSSVSCSYLTGAAPGVVFCCWSPSASGFDVLCVQRCILHILVVTSVYLSYCCLSIISNQSVHSPLTSDINKAFSSTQLPLTGYFLFFRPFSVDQQFLKYSDQPVCTNNHSTFSHLNPLSSLAAMWLADLCYQAIEQVYLIKWPVSVYSWKKYFQLSIF